MLTDLLKDEFEPQVRKRGQSYASSGLVRHLRVHDCGIDAEVHGAETYSVVIEPEFEPDRWDLLALCTCPYAETAPCKHVWAVLLKAEREAIAQWGGLPKHARLFIDDEEFAEAAEDEPEFDPEPSRPAARIPIRAPNGQVAYVLSRPARQRQSATPPEPKRPAWERLLEQAPRDYGAHQSNPSGPIGPLRYVLDAERSRMNGAITLVLTSDPPDGARARPKRVTIAPESLPRLTDPQDRAIGAMLVGAALPGRESIYSYSYGSRSAPSAVWQLQQGVLPLLIPMLVGTGRFGWAPHEGEETRPLVWDEHPWRLSFIIEPLSAKKRGTTDAYVLRGGLVRESERVPLDGFDVLVEGSPGLALRTGVLSPMCSTAPTRALDWLKRNGAVAITPDDAVPLLRQIERLHLGIPVHWPADWPVRERDDIAPRPRLTLKTPDAKHSSGATLESRLSFRYGEEGDADADGGLYLCPAVGDDNREQTIIRRNADAERAAAERLSALGVRRDPYEPSRSTFPAKKLTRLIAPLIDEGWEVRGEGGLFRAAGKIDIRVSSGIDWFDAHGEADFGGTTAPIADVLDALRRGERFVTLGDGSQGMLPDKWLERHAPWLRMGETRDGALRFSRAQLSVIDALLAELPDATCDAQVAEARRKLAAFDGVNPRTEPRAFKGELRPYQRLGLGWLHFLDEFGFGGCLADDMGLGKTVQVLAYLAERATPEARAGAGPWLVVAPRSLIFNWIREAARFTPHLRVADHTGQDRAAAHDALADTDLVVTTYGTLRRDIEPLRELDLAGVVLDEAQAIKNAQSQSAKAARLLRARRRLALTGTPVENSLDDLWSIFDFLNPGMLGTASAFALAAKAARTDEGKPDLSLLRRALRPFILRRTKQTVAPELPPRTEQTIPCELAGRQRTIYEGLRKHYRDELLGRVDREGMNKSRMHVLEALLRLRQAACHPMLIEPKATRSESAKLATLMEMLAEIAAEGNKALVFSQFTSLLDLMQRSLDAAKLPYERLDGQTPAAERARRVDRFQAEGGAPVFLISLKAGGVGLNLTAAQYVFLLDPWWNPAVEAQAIDRTHRIGQDRRVSAYRLIAKGTVEERILELQAAKRELAEAIVAENAGGLKGLSRDDLEWLLS